MKPTDPWCMECGNRGDSCKTCTDCDKFKALIPSEKVKVKKYESCLDIIPNEVVRRKGSGERIKVDYDLPKVE